MANPPRHDPQPLDASEGKGFGKLILFGEHAVVYDEPGIAAGLPAGATARATHCQDGSLLRLFDQHGQEVTRVRPGEESALARSFESILNAVQCSDDVSVQVRVGVPLGAGLGSSAAIATAVARCLARPDFDQDEVVEKAVAASENIFHTNASGIDDAAARLGGIFAFQRGKEPTFLSVEALQVSICQPDRPASTAAMVEGVAQLRKSETAAVMAVIQQIGAIARQARNALEAADWEQVGRLMNLNHGLLHALGVSTTKLDQACHIARANGALGAKLTGAGGGGCVVALTPTTGDTVCRAWKQQGWPTTQWTLGNPI